MSDLGNAIGTMHAYVVRYKDTKKAHWITIQSSENTVWCLLFDSNQRGSQDEQIAHLKTYLYIEEIPLENLN